MWLIAIGIVNAVVNVIKRNSSHRKAPIFAPNIASNHGREMNMVRSSFRIPKKQIVQKLIFFSVTFP